MSGQARLTLCSAAATLLTSCALLPLVQSSAWIVQAAILLAIQAGVGALARRVPLARPLTVAAQALVALLLLTLVFARGQAVVGVLPGPEVFREFGLLLQDGAEDVGMYSIPAPLSDGIRLMIVGGVLVIGLAVDALAVTFRSAAPAGLPLLALYSVAAGLSDGGAGWVWFLLAAAGYLMLLLAEGRDRLSQWGRIFGGAPRTGRLPGGPESPGGGAVSPVRTGRRIGALALGIALVVPLALPALDGGLLDGTGAGTGTGPGGGGTISAVNPLVSLQNSLNQPEDREVMRYRTNTDDTQDLYLRIVSLDDFDGTAWKPSVRSIGPVPDTFPNPQGLSGSVRRTEIQTNIQAAGWYAQDWLPMPYPASQVEIEGRWRYEPVGRTLVGDRGQTTRGADYDVKSLIVQPTAAQLATAPEPPSNLRREFTKVPDSLPPVVAATARRVTQGAANDYERAVKLQDWFAYEGGFTYDTQVEAGSGSAAIARFLQQKEGFCVHFSFAMAAMARTLGIPARVAVGFTPGSPESDGSMAVGLRDAHAWPELYFEGVGWTRFEPTPNRGTVPDYTRSDTPAGTPSNPAVPQPSASAAPSAAPSPSESCPAQERKQGGCASTAPQATNPSDAGGPPWGLIGGVTLAVLAALAVPLLPLLWRLRVRAVRLGTPVYGGALHASAVESSEEKGAAASQALGAWQEATDTAWDYGIPPDDSQTPRKAAARIVRLGELDPEAAESVHRLAAGVEQVLYAPRPQPPAGLADDVRRVRDGLSAKASRARRLRAMFAPRSAVRVLWALSDRWTTLRAGWTERWAAHRPTVRRPRASRQEG